MTQEFATVAAAAIAATGAIAAAAVSVFAHRGTREVLRENTAKTHEQLRENTAKTDQVLVQVANDHDSNLREDLDDVRGDVAQVQADLGHLGGLMGRVLARLEESLTHSREHEAGAALVLGALEARDRALDERLRAVEHPEGPPAGD